MCPVEMDPVSFGNRSIGPGEPAYVIAEIGVNHNGQRKRAVQLLKKAAAAGADAVKFQIYRTDSLVSPSAELAPYQEDSHSREIKSQRELLLRMELPFQAFEELREIARENEVDFLATPFDFESLDFLVDLDPPAVKIGSGDLVYHQLLKKVRETDLPVILSTGMADFEEIDRAVSVLRPGAKIGEKPPQSAEHLILLYCVSLYPADLEEFDMSTLHTLQQRYGVPVGFSDHSTGYRAADMAVALGATVFEKHVTLDNDDEGPDHAASLEIPDFFEYVERIRTAEKALGDGGKHMTEREREMRTFARRSVAVIHNMEEGETLEEKDLLGLRPATGIPVSEFESVLGKTVARSVRAGTILTEENLE